MISTGDINVFTDAPATDTFGEIGALMNKMMEYPDGSRDTAYCIELGVEVNYPEDYENVEDLIPDPQHLRLVGDALTLDSMLKTEELFRRGKRPVCRRHRS